MIQIPPAAFVFGCFVLAGALTVYLVRSARRSMEKGELGLDELGILHYALAGLCWLTSVYLGLAYVQLLSPGPSPPPSPPGGLPLPLPSILVVVAVLFTFGCFLWFVGESLRARRRYMLCRRSTIVTCVLLPLGTALGVCTRIYLRRSHVRIQFQR